jgi:glycerophosphoryl diester phosphodiesterase
MEEALIGLLRAHDLLPRSVGDDRVIVQSFSAASLRRVHALDAGIPLVQLYRSRESSRSIRAKLDSVGELVYGIGPNFEDVDPALVAAARSRGLVIHPYTVNVEADMRRMIDLGVDGMFTDYPDRLSTLLGR